MSIDVSTWFLIWYEFDYFIAIEINDLWRMLVISLLKLQFYNLDHIICWNDSFWLILFTFVFVGVRSRYCGSWILPPCLERNVEIGAAEFLIWVFLVCYEVKRGFAFPFEVVLKYPYLWSALRQVIDFAFYLSWLIYF